MSYTVCGKEFRSRSGGLMDLTARSTSCPYDEAVKVKKATLEKIFWNGGDFYGPRGLTPALSYFTKYPEDRNKVSSS
ncbi:hypothetical protein V1508DRAFT_44241 [Lipomyces doorenjongii]|uniref:uncharacterized protein n=1 Tax=Lipomyces doorenjongii TaxID=383834 RepID=UPI0034CF3405